LEINGGPGMMREGSSSAVEQQLVDVGGYQLALQRRGAGAPVVVLDAGMGQSSATWSSIFDAVARFTQVVAYDRAGRGASDPAPVPRTLQEVVADLHKLLVGAAVPAPYVLVGHSFAGLVSGLYAHAYPDEVVGLVFVDASHPLQWSRQAAALPPEAPGESEELQKLRAFLHQQLRDPTGNPERIDMGTSTEQAWVAGALGARPVLVLSATRSPLPPGLGAEVIGPVQAAWHDLHRDLARLSSHSRHIVVEGSGHFVQVDKPEVVINAIRQAVEIVRGESQP
jgi:pimeloyl-ACP methyl ester carboxylesterase